RGVDAIGQASHGQLDIFEHRQHILPVFGLPGRDRFLIGKDGLAGIVGTAPHPDQRALVALEYERGRAERWVDTYFRRRQRGQILALQKLRYTLELAPLVAWVAEIIPP